MLLLYLGGTQGLAQASARQVLVYWVCPPARLFPLCTQVEAWCPWVLLLNHCPSSSTLLPESGSLCQTQSTVIAQACSGDSLSLPFELGITKHWCGFWRAELQFPVFGKCLDHSSLSSLLLRPFYFIVRHSLDKLLRLTLNDYPLLRT